MFSPEQDEFYAVLPAENGGQLPTSSEVKPAAKRIVGILPLRLG